MIKQFVSGCCSGCSSKSIASKNAVAERWHEFAIWMIFFEIFSSIKRWASWDSLEFMKLSDWFYGKQEFDVASWRLLTFNLFHLNSVELQSKTFWWIFKEFPMTAKPTWMCSHFQLWIWQTDISLVRLSKKLFDESWMFVISFRKSNRSLIFHSAPSRLPWSKSLVASTTRWWMKRFS